MSSLRWRPTGHDRHAAIGAADVYRIHVSGTQVRLARIPRKVLDAENLHGAVDAALRTALTMAVETRTVAEAVKAAKEAAQEFEDGGDLFLLPEWQHPEEGRTT